MCVPVGATKMMAKKVELRVICACECVLVCGASEEDEVRVWGSKEVGVWEESCTMTKM